MNGVVILVIGIVVMEKLVQIDHGNGIVTLYGHNSAKSCSQRRSDRPRRTNMADMGSAAIVQVHMFIMKFVSTGLTIQSRQFPVSSE